MLLLKVQWYEDYHHMITLVKRNTFEAKELQAWLTKLGYKTKVGAGWNTSVKKFMRVFLPAGTKVGQLWVRQVMQKAKYLSVLKRYYEKGIFFLLPKHPAARTTTTYVSLPKIM